MDLNELLVSDATLINSSNLKMGNRQKKIIKEHITEILRKINEEIINTHREGHYNITSDLPIIFDIPNMTNKDAQYSIWAGVMYNLESKGYFVKINFNIHKCVIKITWLNEKDIQHRQKQLNIIEKNKTDVL